eukprot:309326_1
MTLRSQFVSLFKLLLKLQEYLSASKLRKCIAVLLFCECIFYARHKHLESYVNQMCLSIVHPRISKKKIKIMRKYSEMYMHYFTGSYRKWLAKRFNCSFEQIKKQNIEHFLKWAYFVKFDERTVSTLDLTEAEWRETFITDYITDIETRLNHKFEPGYNKNIQTISCTTQIHKIPIIFHPLTMYLSIAITKQIVHIIFGYYFKFKYKYIRGLKVWYRLNDANDLSNIETIENMEPILLFGGVGAANPMQWIVFINKLIGRFQWNKCLFIIEIPWSEMSIQHFIPNSGYLKHNLPLTMKELTDIVFDLEYIILKHNTIGIMNYSIEKMNLQWTLIGESFGTFMCSAIYQRIKELKLGIIPRLILIDAPTLCMSDPSANRLQGIVENDLEKILFQMVVGKEIMIATMGARYFHWMEYCIFPHQLVNDGCQRQHIVISGTKDHVIPFNTIKIGIQEANKLISDENKHIVHIIMDGVKHGVFMVHDGYQKRLIDLL